ncbi:MAG: hypothetical protein AAFN94_14655 [Pseudomonadota bacterium]
MVQVLLNMVAHGSGDVVFARGPDQMHAHSLADALSDVRAEIGRLRQREAALRAAILAKRGQVPPGRWNRVEIVEQRARIFDRTLLPREIASNPAYFRDRVTTYVKCLPVQVGGTRPDGSPPANTHPGASVTQHVP